MIPSLLERLCARIFPMKNHPRGASLAWLCRLAIGPILLSGLVLGGGCAGPEEEVRSVAPEFTAETLRNGGLAILGVVQVDEVPQVRPPLIEALERVLGATRHDLRVVPAAKVDAVMGDSTTRFLLLGYQMHDRPDPDWFERATDSLRATARYGVLARVESDALRYSGQDVANLPYEQTPEVRVVGREAKVEVHVYDLTTRAIVFHNTYSGSAEAAATDTIPQAVLPPSPGEVQVTPRRQPQPYPESPPLAKALERAFLEFARELPGGPPPPPKK